MYIVRIVRTRHDRKDWEEKKGKEKRLFHDTFRLIWKNRGFRNTIPNMKRLSHRSPFHALALIFLCVAPSAAYAQMFSSGGDSPANRIIAPSRGVSIGPSFSTFSSTSGTGDLSFDGTLLTVGLQTSGLSVDATVGPSSWNPQGATLFRIGAMVGGRVSLYRGELFSLFAPAGVSSDYLRVSREIAEREFRQSSFRILGGLGLSLANRGFRLSVSATPSIGFSYSQGSLFGGSVRGFTAGATVGSIKIASLARVSAFARYELLAYDIDFDLYDYELDSRRFGLVLQF